jgi:glycosyltransferase involved in cell wall biosynthesis
LEKKIRLFADAHSFDKEFQGVRTFIKEIYTVLLAQYPDLDIFFGCTNVAQLQKEFPLAKPENFLPYKSGGFSRFYSDIPRMIREHKIDFAHFQYMVPFGRKQCRYITTTHDILFNDFAGDFSWPYRLARNYLFRRGIQKADIKTTVSTYSRERIAHYYKIPPNEIAVIPNGVHASFASQFISQQQAAAYIRDKYDLSDYILYVSRLEPRKNQLALIKAWAATGMHKKNIALVFIGKESITVQEFNRLLHELGKQYPVYYIPQVDPRSLEAFYKGSKLFVYPSRAEGFGIPPLEAAIAQAPVLCSRETAMMDFDFFEPWRFDPSNQQELENKLTAIIESPPGKEKLAEISRQVLQKYSWHESARLLHELIVKPRPLIVSLL